MFAAVCNWSKASNFPHLSLTSCLLQIKEIPSRVDTSMFQLIVSYIRFYRTTGSNPKQRFRTNLNLLTWDRIQVSSNILVDQCNFYRGCPWMRAPATWQTADGLAPPDKPECGFFDELCPPDTSGSHS